MGPVGPCSPGVSLERSIDADCPGRNRSVGSVEAHSKHFIYRHCCKFHTHFNATTLRDPRAMFRGIHNEQNPRAIAIEDSGSSRRGIKERSCGWVGSYHRLHRFRRTPWPAVGPKAHEPIVGSPIEDLDTVFPISRGCHRSFNARYGECARRTPPLVAAIPVAGAQVALRI